MTWFSKKVAFCAVVILLVLLGYTLYMCKRDCKDEPDDPVCGRWNFTMDDAQRSKSADFEWLRNECERKCFQHGTYERADMNLCYQKGQNRTSYICKKHYDRRVVKQCMKNESLRGN